ncbi:MAG: segregation/condensation protein A, partial [Dehalococcoidia bacterium]|nr:segregation/condensation protein A [Dehalococcoidia bacterium]
MPPDPATPPLTRVARSDFPVRLPIFEGPLDLLLTLIERNDLPISAVSLVAVTEQFLAALEDSVEHDLDAIAGFLVVAAKLTYLKSVWLLPKPPAPADRDEPDPLEDAEALARQVREYRRFK